MTPSPCPECHVYHLPGDYCDPDHLTTTVQRFFTRSTSK